VRAAIEAKGAQLFLLPPYSPDMNPIEMAFAKLKTLLRQAPERPRDGLWNRIGELLDRFTPDECANYFRAAGSAPCALRYFEGQGSRNARDMLSLSGLIKYWKKVRSEVLM
jgi:DDE superfamily endonuclease